MCRLPFDHKQNFAHANSRLFEFSICIIIFLNTYGTFGKFVSGVEEESSKEIATSSSSIFGFEIFKVL
jgi:hypothetical protein